jgi:drug/metabolite transporter (DMT)-like permease
MDEPNEPKSVAMPSIAAGFATIYLVWGSTYLATKFAVATLPPLLMAGSRFILAGLLLYAIRRRQGVPRPQAENWRRAFVVGALLLTLGNGLVTWGQQFVPSGTTALLIATTPIWMALIGWIFFQGPKPGPRILMGMALGFSGAAILVQPAAPAEWQRTWPGVLAILLAPLAWSTGSLQSRKTPPTDDSFLSSAMLMLCGGALMFLVGTLRGEWALLYERTISVRSVLALGYLTLIGSLVGFTTFAWLIRVASPTAVATYAYVNPLVAVLLGWLIANETLEPRVLLAGGLIVGAVVLITWPRAPVAIPPEEVEKENVLSHLSCKRIHGSAVRR